MTEYEYRPETYTVDKGQLLNRIMEIAVARQAFPLNFDTKIEDSITYYDKIIGQDNVKYEMELVHDDISAYLTERTKTNIPLIQGRLSYNRHQIKKIARGLLPLDKLQLELLSDMLNKEEKVAWAGDTTQGVTSFADTTNNTTVITDELDLGTYAEAVEHLAKMKSQILTGLKNQYQNTPLVLAVTPDVLTRMESLLNTNADRTFMEYVIAYLGKSAGGVISTPYLGSATGEGTTNAVLIAKSPTNLQLKLSKMDVNNVINDKKGLDVMLDERAVPVFMRQEACIYSGTVVLVP